MAGQDDLWAWLQSLQPNQGAAQPYGPGGVPGPYSGGPEGLMPGGGLMGRQGATPGAPSMGYPAMGKFSAQPAQRGGFNPFDLLFPPANAAEAPAPSQTGDSVTVNPHGDGPPDVTSPGDLANRSPNPQPPPQPGPTPVAAGPATYPHMPWPGSPPSPSPQTYPHMPWPDTGAAKGPLASSDAPAAAPMKRRAGAANLGYYQPNSRFIGIDQPNASPQNSMRAGPQATALNLAGLFGGRGQGAVNPNAPAANAQPVSASAPAGQSNAPANYGPLQQGNSIWDILSKAPWSYGPLQQGNIWQGSGGPGR